MLHASLPSCKTPRFPSSASKPEVERTICYVQDDVAGCFEYYADLAEKLDKSQDTPVELPMEEFKTVLRREPLGVVGAISAWNYPMLIATVS